MVEDKISLLLKEITELKEKIKDIKKDIKDEEKIENEQYNEMKKALKELKEQVKDFENDWLADLQSDESYNRLRELRVQKEEELGQAFEKLNQLLLQLPPKPFLMNLETEGGPVKVQIQPEMKIYLNGKEEKRR